VADEAVRLYQPDNYYICTRKRTTNSYAMAVSFNSKQRSATIENKI
jgi:hypothetical protein